MVAGAVGRCRWQVQVAGAGGRCRWQVQVAGAGGRCSNPINWQQKIIFSHCMRAIGTSTAIAKVIF